MGQSRPALIALAASLKPRWSGQKYPCRRHIMRRTTNERLGTDTIATLDRREFSVVRPRPVVSFTLVP